MPKIEFKIVDKKFFKMTDPERIAAMNKIADDHQGTHQYNQDEQVVNPFPRWLKNAIKAMQKSHKGTRLEFDTDGRMYFLHFKGDLEKASDLCADYDELYAKALETEKAVKGSPVQTWLDDNHPHYSIHMEDEIECLKEVDAHHSASAAAARKTDRAKEA